MAKLPADLPENWTSGQIISPNGTEVGLDAKHGYNYLMKQVNAAQTGVNTLNDNMTGVAQESTLQGVKTDVETLNTKVGSSGDTGTTTVMGKLNEIKEILDRHFVLYFAGTTITGGEGTINQNFVNPGTSDQYKYVKLTHFLPKASGTVKITVNATATVIQNASSGSGASSVPSFAYVDTSLDASQLATGSVMFTSKQLKTLTNTQLIPLSVSSDSSIIGQTVSGSTDTEYTVTAGVPVSILMGVMNRTNFPNYKYNISATAKIQYTEVKY